MPAEDEIVAQAITVQSPDTAEQMARRRAKSIVHEALRSASTPLDNRDLKKRLLPGLWHASISVLIECLGMEEVIALLADRGRGIVGSADNADAPPRTITEKAMPAYMAEVGLASETIIECLESAQERLESEDLEDRFPETVLDAALLVLLSAWGPDHVRRAIAEQASLLIQGKAEVANVMEPIRYMTPPQDIARQDREKEEPRSGQLPPPPPETLMPPEVPSRRRTAKRRVEAWVWSDLAPSGRSAWAVWLSSIDDDRREERLVSGIGLDPNGRMGWVKALHECVLAICSDTAKAFAKVEMNSEDMLRALHGSPGTRNQAEEKLWQEIDNACAIHEIEFRHAPDNLTLPHVEKCDMQVRMLLAEA